MAQQHGTNETHNQSNIMAGSKLTPVQWAFPNPFPRAGDITLLLGKVSLPLLKRRESQHGRNHPRGLQATLEGILRRGVLATTAPSTLGSQDRTPTHGPQC